MDIDIISDTVCPWCFVGKRRLERALAAAPQPDLRIGWRPFQLNPDMPRAGLDRRDYMTGKFGAERLAQIHKTLDEIGAAEGIAFDFAAIKRQPNTLDSHRLLHYAGEQGAQDAVAEAMFRAFFQEGRDIGDRATLVDIGAGAGLERAALADYFAGERGLDQILAEDKIARDIGVNGVPTFVLERKYVVSGAQSPEAFLRIFELVKQKAAEEATPESAQGD